MSNDNSEERENETRIHELASEGSVERMKSLIQEGNKVDAADEQGETSVHHAVQNGHAEALEVLLSAGADPTQANDKGWTPIHEAAKSGSEETVKLLLDEGADVDRESSSDGWMGPDATPLYEAISQGHETDLPSLRCSSGRAP